MTPVIRITDAMWERLKKWAEPLDDKAEDAICKVLDVAEEYLRVNKQQAIKIINKDIQKRTTYSNKLRKGVKTPQGAYRLPILAAIYELGGSAPMSNVLNIVKEKMKHLFSEVDYQQIPSGVDVRWRNTAMWERSNMVKDELLKDNSPRGIWELSEQGLIEIKKLLK